MTKNWTGWNGKYYDYSDKTQAMQYNSLSFLSWKGFALFLKKQRKNIALFEKYAYLCRSYIDMSISGLNIWQAYINAIAIFIAGLL